MLQRLHSPRRVRAASPSTDITGRTRALRFGWPVTALGRRADCDGPARPSAPAHHHRGHHRGGHSPGRCTLEDSPTRLASRAPPTSGAEPIGRSRALFRNPGRRDHGQARGSAPGCTSLRQCPPHVPSRIADVHRPPSPDRSSPWTRTSTRRRCKRCARSVSRTR